MKWMILVLVAVVVLYIVRSKKQSKVKPPPPRPPSVGASEAMLRCAQCGVYLPASESVSDATGLVYCSDEHRLRHPTH